jgi:hypothetical protein
VTALAICSALFGLALGIRFKFFGLVPILFMELLLVAALSIAQDLPLAEALCTAVVFACFLQFGYLISAVLRHVVSPAIIVARDTRLGESEALLRP